MPRNFNKFPPEDRPAARGTGSKWTGTKGAKYDQAGGTDQQRREQSAAAAAQMKRSDGGLSTDPKKDLPVKNDDFIGRAFKKPK